MILQKGWIMERKTKSFTEDSTHYAKPEGNQSCQTKRKSFRESIVVEVIVAPFPFPEYEMFLD
jgi:hypothetical protein